MQDSIFVASRAPLPPGHPPSATPGAQPLAQGLPSLRWLAFAAVYLIWGSTYLGIRVGVETIPPLLLAGGRSFIAGALLFTWSIARGARWPSSLEWRRAAVAGVLMLAGGNGLVTLAERDVPSNLAALMLAAVPAYVVLLDWWRPGGSRPARRALLGIVLGSFGMLLLVRPGADGLGASHWYGVAALLLAGLCWAAGSLYARYRPQYPSSAVAGSQQMLAGGGSMLSIGAARGELAQLEATAVSVPSLLSFIYLTVFGSLVAFSAFAWLTPRTTPSQLATTSYVNPMVALLLGWLVLGETLHPVSFAGAALIVAAVFIMLARRAPPRTSVGPAPPAAPPGPPSVP